MPATADDILQTIIRLANVPPGGTPLFFGVVNLNPSARVSHSSSGSTLSFADIIVREYTVVGTQEGEDLEETDAPPLVVEALDGVGRLPLRPWCTRQGFNRVAAHLTRWQMHDMVEKAVA